MNIADSSPDFNIHPDPAETVKFLRAFYGDDLPWWLSRIKKDLPPPANVPMMHALLPNPDRDSDRLVPAYIKSWNEKGWDLYFNLAILARTNIRFKASKADVAKMPHLWAEIDPPENLRGDGLNAWRKDMFERLGRGTFFGRLSPPTIILDSGRGFWLLWKLLTAFEINGDPIQIARFEATLRGIAQGLGGDVGCCNVDRIGRLTGTINWMSQKSKKGIAPAVAKTIKIDPDCAHRFEDFPAAEAAKTSKPNGEGEYTGFHGTGNLDLEDLNFWTMVNGLALWPVYLAKWVPALFPFEHPDIRRYQGGFRITSKALGRELEEDISITPKGIKDFGVHDMGDKREGKRSAIDLVMEWGPPLRHLQVDEPEQAALWLCERMEVDPKDLGWRGPKSNGGAKPGGEAKADTANQQGKWENGDGSYSLSELEYEVIAELEYLVPGLICEGLTILAGRPKIGKSWLALLLALSVALGLICLNAGTPCIKRDVLYVGLEDTKRRMQGRVRKILKNAGRAWPTNFTVYHRWQRGDLAKLEKWAAEHPNGLIVIDVWVKFRGRKSHKRDSYEEDHEQMSSLQELAGKYRQSVLILHHTKKGGAEDILEEVSGTSGITGGADTVMILKKTASGVIMGGAGRDLPDDIDYAMEFDRETCVWKVLGKRAAVFMNATYRKIYETLQKAEAQNLSPLSPTEITNLSGLKVQTVKNTLPSMLADGWVKWAGYGKWEIDHDNCPPENYEF